MTPPPSLSPLPGGGHPHPPLTVGSLFTGYGGLDVAVRQVLGGRLAWVSDIDPGANALLAHRHPDVPNLGDVSAIDWTTVEPVDVLAGGFPCTDVSLAGQMAGLREGTRSGLWIQMARAIDALQPRLVVIENVRGLCSAPAHSDLEPCPWCLGDDEGVPLRALGAVLGDLADLGYDTEWCGLRAADAGAPHGRFRVFIVAVPSVARGVGSNPAGDGRDERWTQPAGQQRGPDVAVGGAQPAAHAQGDGHGHTGPAGVGGVSTAAVAGGERDAAPDADGHAVRQQPVGQSGRSGAPVAGLAGTDDPVPHPDGVGRERPRPARDGGTGPTHDGEPASDADGEGREGPEPARRRDLSARGAAADPNRERQQQRQGDVADLAGRADDRTALIVGWGDYEPGISSWGRVLGRPAPAPRTWSTTYRRQLQQRLDGHHRKPVGMRGSLAPQYSLNPRFVEWLMGLPAGWVCDVPGLTPNQMLRLLGNGVVPQQGAAALTYLLSVSSAAAAA